MQLSETRFARTFQQLNQMKVLVLLLPVVLSFASVATTNAQAGMYWVTFNNKPECNFDPVEYFQPKALERRTRQGLQEYDDRDLPVNEDYLVQLRALCDSIDGVSRWLNAAVVHASLDQVERVRLLSFVTDVMPIGTLEITGAMSEGDSLMLLLQTERMRGSLFTNAGYTGKGLRIAIFDVGFPKVDEHPAFEHIRERNGIIATYDFSRKTEDVYRGAAHGTSVMSCIAGMKGAAPIGLAYDADFLLARTERLLTEFTAEEHRWVFAAEWADKMGADIISSSLGYTVQRYFIEDMDGRTSMISRAANIAASKGILVINSAGNEGDTRWRTVGAPADADSVLAIGGTDPYTDVGINFTSLGPTADLRMKPNVCAFGTAVAASRKNYSVASGTSFAAPLVAGFAACAWQANPLLSNMELFKAIEESGHLAPYYDYVHGYGIPQADKFLGEKKVDTTFVFEESKEAVSVALADTFVLKRTFFDPFESVSTEGSGGYEGPKRNLYYHVSYPDGLLKKYGVVLGIDKRPLVLVRGLDYEKGELVRIHFEGFTDTITIE